MLNTSSLNKNNSFNFNSNLFKNETVINKGIRQINENSNNNLETNEPSDNEIIKSFHSMENMIFQNIMNNVPEKKTFEIDNFNLEEITKKFSDDEIKRNILDINNNKQLLITINTKLNKFSVYNDQQNLIGFFTINHIIKYLGNFYDDKQQFLPDIDITIFKKSKELIKMLIFKLKYNKKTKYSDIVIHDYGKSGFMGDIELLIKLNNGLHNYLNQNIQNDLAKIDTANKIKIEVNIKKFIFILLNYTLKIISIASEQLQNNKEISDNCETSNNSKNELKERLINYSIGTVYRINLFVQEQFKVIDKQNNSINKTLNENIKIKYELKDKIDLLTQNIQNTQNNQKNKNILNNQKNNHNNQNIKINKNTNDNNMSKYDLMNTSVKNKPIYEF